MFHGSFSHARALVAALALFAVPTASQADEILVFAAASLKDALDAVATEFNEATGHEAQLAFAGSAQLARQIQQGAPADVYVSANSGWMDTLEAENLLAPGTRRDLLNNRIVLIAHDPEAEPLTLNAETDLTGLLDGGRLAMALTEAVPAGIYGKAGLEHYGLWDGVAGQVVEADNVRAALALVATGAAPLGITYATDAHAEPRVSVVATFPEESHPAIIYPVAALAGHDTPAAAAFLAFLGTPEARAAFGAQGFTVLDE